MQQQVVYHNPNIQISSLEVPVGMVDGILANPRNPVNHDLWLTGRFWATLSNKIGHGTNLGRPFQGFRVPTKFYRGQDAGFDGGSSSE